MQALDLGVRDYPADRTTNIQGKGAIMSLPSTIDTAFVRQYSSQLYILSQRKGKLAMAVRQEMCQGESKSFERLGEAEVQEITSRHSDTPNNELPHTRRWVTPKDYDTNAYVDKQDEIKMLVQPTNSYMQQQARGLARQTDDIIYAAGIGTAASGVTPTTSTVAFKDESISINGDGTATTLGTAAVIGTPVNMTLAKIATMQQLFDDEDVDEEIPRYWAIAPSDVRAMLQIATLTSTDYVALKPLETGKIVTFYGFNFIKYTGLSKDSTEVCVRTLSWAKDGIIYASGQSVNSRIDERADKRYTTQVYSAMNGGAVRMEGAKVHECLNKIA